MDEQTVFNIMQTEGYHFLDKPHPHSPGYTGLLVAIRETPSGQHFDPESIVLYLSEPSQTVGSVKLKFKSSFSGIQQLCPGKVVLHDRIDKRVYFFVYGGTLESMSRNGTTVYVLRSPAPILVMSNGSESVPEQLASETEALLAKIHASWGLNDDEFNYHLTQIEPLAFYTATIQSILHRYQQSLALRESYHSLYEILLSEKEWLNGLARWPAAPLGLEDLLGSV